MLFAQNSSTEIYNRARRTEMIEKKEAILKLANIYERTKTGNEYLPLMALFVEKSKHNINAIMLAAELIQKDYRNRDIYVLIARFAATVDINSPVYEDILDLVYSEYLKIDNMVVKLLEKSLELESGNNENQITELIDKLKKINNEASALLR